MEVRIDKWWWAVRLYKIRSLATEACKKGRVQIQGTAVKPSRVVKTGDIIQIKHPPVVYSFKVLAPAQNRMNARLVPEFMENVTTADQLELIELGKLAAKTARERGTGRPTKKERRDMDDFFEPFFTGDDDE